MKKMFLLFVFQSLFVLTYAQENSEYEKFKTGTFTYAAPGFSDVRIIRTRKKQVEILNGGKSKIIMKIKWLNDSTYVLTLVKAKNAPGCLEKGDTVTTVITGSTGDQYTCRSATANCGGAEMTIRKLE